MITFGIDFNSLIESSTHSSPFLLPIVTLSVSNDPPNRALSSARITRAPFFAADRALAIPEGPDPTTRISQCSY